jgi:hypothetical protein
MLAGAGIDHEVEPGKEIVRQCLVQVDDPFDPARTSDIDHFDIDPQSIEYRELVEYRFRAPLDAMPGPDLGRVWPLRQAVDKRSSENIDKGGAGNHKVRISERQGNETPVARRRPAKLDRFDQDFEVKRVDCHAPATVAPTARGMPQF